MKKIILSVLSVFIVLTITRAVYAMPAGETQSPADNEGVSVTAVLSAVNKQPHPTFTTDINNLDTVWIFFDDGSFKQFVNMDDQILMFSCGTCSGESDNTIIINRTRKYMEGAGVRDYSSVHKYILNTDEYTELLNPADKDVKASAVFAGIAVQPYADGSGSEVLLDTCWIFYSDGSFEQFVISDNTILPFSSGTYYLREEESVHAYPAEVLTQDCSIVINYDNSQDSEYIFETQDYQALFIAKTLFQAARA